MVRCAAMAGAPPSGWNRNADSVPLPNQGFCWSIAHKHDVAAVAISTGAVGVDVERIVPRGDDLLDAIASNDEWQLVGQRTWSAAYRIWTAKEAVLKAVGVGMAGMDKCKVVECPDDMTTRVSYCGESWLVRHRYVDDVVVAIAGRDDAIEWHLADDRDWKQDRRQDADVGAGSRNAASVPAPLLDKEGLGEVPVRSSNPPQSPLGKGGGKSANLSRDGDGRRFTRPGKAS